MHNEPIGERKRWRLSYLTFSKITTRGKDSRHFRCKSAAPRNIVMQEREWFLIQFEKIICSTAEITFVASGMSLSLLVRYGAGVILYL